MFSSRGAPGLANAALPQQQPDRTAISRLIELAERKPPPEGVRVVLPGRGTTYIRAPRGPAGAPAVVLLHGWIASGGLNWFQAFDPLRRGYRVLAMDLRGHARGIQSWRFRLRDCADDVAALLKRRRIPKAIVVGYSMGGPVAQLVWRRHPELVSGLVLAATSGRPLRNQGLGFAMSGIMEGAALAGRAVGMTSLFRRAVALSSDPEIRELREERLPVWARGEMRRHHVRHLLEAGAELGRYDATPWLDEIDVPTSVIVTSTDGAIPQAAQLALAASIRRSRIYMLPGGHLSFARPSFGATLRTAVDHVAARAAKRRS